MSNKIGVETILKLWASWKDWILTDCSNNKSVTSIKVLLRKSFAEELHLRSKEFNVSWCFARIYMIHEMVQDVPEKISRSLDHLREVTTQVIELMPGVFAPVKDTPLELLNLSIKALEEETVIEYAGGDRGFHMHKVWRGESVSIGGLATISQEAVERFTGDKVQVTLPWIVMLHQGGRALANFEDSEGAVQFQVSRYSYFPDRGYFAIYDIGQHSDRLPKILRVLAAAQQLVNPLYATSPHVDELHLTGLDEIGRAFN